MGFLGLVLLSCERCCRVSSENVRWRGNQGRAWRQRADEDGRNKQRRENAARRQQQEKQAGDSSSPFFGSDSATSRHPFARRARSQRTSGRASRFDGERNGGKRGRERESPLLEKRLEISFSFFPLFEDLFFFRTRCERKFERWKKRREKQGGMPLAAWRNCGPLAPCLGSQRMQRSCADARALPSPSATRNLEQPRRMRTRGGIEAPIATTQAPPGPSCRPRPRPVAAVATCRAGGSSGSAGRLSSRGLPLPTLTASSPPEKSISSSRVAAKRGGGDGDEKEKQGGGGGGAGLLSRWAQLTAREKSVVVAFVALAVLFGPRLLLLSLVSLEAAATGALLAAERALGAAFLTSFTWLAAVAALILAGLLVYFLVLEEERLEDSDDE